MALIGTISFVVAVGLLLSRRSEAMKALTGAELLAMLGLILGGMVLGWLLGGPQAHTRNVLATGTSMRNAALCLMIALSSFAETKAVVAVVAFSGLMIFPNMLFTVYEVIRGRRQERVAGEQTPGGRTGRNA